MKKKSLFITFLSESNNKMLSYTFCKFMLIIYVLKISSKSIDAKTSDRHRKMRKSINFKG